jgi:predicted DNA-binding transcriptional regulator YafY
MYNQHKILRVFQLINLLKSKPAKSIRTFAKILEIDSRSVYRYFDLLHALGFQLEKDSFNRFCLLSGNIEEGFMFTAEESVWLKELISTLGNGHPLRDGLLKKIYVNSEIKIQGQQLFKAHLSKLVEKANQAIQTKQQVLLIKYYSANSQNIEDRLVEPIHFTDNYQHLVAYEVASETIKHFHIERITEIKLLEKPFQFTNQHRISKIDVFGFASNGRKFKINLVMSLRAHLFLREEYPATIPLMKYDNEKKEYQIEIMVNNLAPVKRFMKGLENEVKGELIEVY